MGSMPAFGGGGFGADSPFRSEGLAKMLQAAYQPPPVAEGMPIPDFSRPETQMIDLGAGGLPPGSERQSALGSLGSMMQQIAPMIGGAMSGNKALGQSALKSVGANAGGFTSGQSPMSYLQSSPIATSLAGR